MSARLSISWGTYQKNICNGFSFLQQRGEFVDMTLAADGHHVQVHKMVLCLVSPYIKELVAATQCAHPVIFLNNVSRTTLEHILQYAYTGEALVPRDTIKDFLHACKSLHIKGLENTSTVELHRESETNMCQETTLTDPVEDDDITDISFDDGDHNEKDPFIENNDKMKKTNDNTITTLTEIEKIESKQQLAKTSSPIPGHPSNDTRVQYTISNHGHLQIILNRQLYCYNYKRIKTDEMVWRCLSNKKKCPATVSTKDGKVTRRLRAHNHSFADRTILKRLQLGLVYSDMSEAQSKVNADQKNFSSDISIIKLDDDDDDENE